MCAKQGCGNKVQVCQNLKSCRHYDLAAPLGHRMSVKCRKSIYELTVHVWLLYHQPNFKYCTLYCNGCGMPAGNAYPSGYLVPSPFGGVFTYALIVGTSFPRLYTELMTLPNLIFTEWREISMLHLRRVRHASRERLPFRTPGSVPLLGTCLCSNCCVQFYHSCRIFYRLFTLKTP